MSRDVLPASTELHLDAKYKLTRAEAVTIFNAESRLCRLLSILDQNGNRGRMNSLGGFVNVSSINGPK